MRDFPLTLPYHFSTYSMYSASNKEVVFFLFDLRFYFQPWIDLHIPEHAIYLFSSSYSVYPHLGFFPILVCFVLLWGVFLGEI